MTTTATDQTAQAGSTAEWVGVRMTDPEEGEWTVDSVILDGHTSYLDLRVRRELLASFVACLLDDLDESAAETVLGEAADLLGIESCVESE